MKMYVVLILTMAAFAISGCSGSDDSATKSAATSGSATADSAKTNMAAAPQAQTAPMAPQSAPGQAPLSGKVVKAMHAGGYTYMQVENQGKQFWVAATMMNVKRNDHVAWADAAVMKNFTSSSLRRTFDEILFVSAAKVM